MTNVFDAIVIGSGISGGWAAKELTEKGLKVLMLERGRDIKHPGGYETATKDPWTFQHRGRLTVAQRNSHPVQIRDYPYSEFNENFWVNDLQNPYKETKRFDWYRGYHVGGRSLMWGRHCYRWSDLNFEENAKQGIGVDWPIRYKDIAPWYSYVEKFIGVSGQKENFPEFKNSELQPPMALNCLEEQLRTEVFKKYKGTRLVTPGRVANLTESVHGRSKCQYRNLCSRGCPFGAYFSTQSSTLPATVATGNLTLRPFSIVESIIYDKDKKRATGVVVIDSETKETMEFYSKIIFVNASTLGSAFILLNSVSDAFPNGLGNTSGQLGHNLMDHHFRCGASGKYDGFEDKYYYGRKPVGFFIPRYRNMGTEKRDYLRGYGYQGGAGRSGWQKGIAEMRVGADFKTDLTKPGQWEMGLTAFGETLPYFENKVTLDRSEKDMWGLPLLNIDCEFKENEKKMRVDMINDAADMLEAAGLKDIQTYDNDSFPGMAIHEMGTARMGNDSKTSVLNKWNQMHDVPNVFVTDGSCMASSASQNPSLTYMALTARACDYAVRELKKGNI